MRPSAALDRRTLLALAAAPPAAAQPAGGLRRIGMLFPGAPEMAAIRARLTLEGLRERGFVEGRSLSMTIRAADYQPGALARMAAELAAMDLAAILAVAGPAILAARAAGPTRPIVAIDLESDPVASGFIASLGRPGGSLTGLFLDFPDFARKWLELLAEAVPGLARCAALWDPNAGEVQRSAITAAAAARGIALSLHAAATPDAVGPALAAASAARPDGLVLLSSPLFNAEAARREIAAHGLAARLPIISPYPEFAGSGGLMGYGASIEDLFRQAGGILARVLGGEKPADIPVERPTRLRLAINLTTARALGLGLPPLLLARAEEVID